MPCRPIEFSLRSRILVALVIVLVPAIVLPMIHVYGTRDDLRRNILLFQAEKVSRGIRADTVDQLPLTSKNGEEMYYTLYTPEGELLWHSPNAGRPRMFRPALLDERKRFNGWYSAYAGAEISVPVRLPDGNILMVSKRDEKEREVLDRLLGSRLEKSLFLLMTYGTLAVLLVTFLLRWTMRPVYRAAALTRRIKPDEPGQSIPLAGVPSEMRELVEAANEVLKRLSAAYQREKHFVSDAAHQLRTPLTVLGLMLEEGKNEGRPDWEGIRREFRHMERMVQQLGRLAKSEGMALHAPPKPVNFSRLVRETAAALFPLFEKQGRMLEAFIMDGLHCRCDPITMRELVINLLENALLHGKGTVRVSVLQKNGRILMDVSDEGEGVPEMLRESMFELFRKRESNSPGSGLGLAIARQTARNAGGSVAFISSSPCVLRLDIPKAAAE